VAGWAGQMMSEYKTIVYARFACWVCTLTGADCKNSVAVWTLNAFEPSEGEFLIRLNLIVVHFQ
jgi:hypothetical protein